MSIFYEAIDYAWMTSKAHAKVKVKGVYRRVIAEEVINRLKDLGVSVQSERTLQRYVKDGLIPMPERKSGGRGVGKITDYSIETPSEFYASHKLKHEHRLRSDLVARCREKGLLMEHKNSGLGFADWLFGEISPEEQIEAGYGQTWLKEKHRALSDHKHDECLVCRNLKIK